MRTDHRIWDLALFYWDRAVTKWAHWDLNILKITNMIFQIQTIKTHAHTQRHGGTAHLKASRVQTLTSEPHKSRAWLARGVGSKAPPGLEDSCCKWNPGELKKQTINHPQKRP